MKALCKSRRWAFRVCTIERLAEDSPAFTCESEIEDYGEKTRRVIYCSNVQDGVHTLFAPRAAIANKAGAQAVRL